ncbi:MAG: winged helix-turn-helix transcriptional regulator [Bacteroidales bacterium]|jgi:predicted transcriptional regulator|nr:winged helix-turn-helix transcriptional regulator [Bacteroidales bacterium]
MKIPCELIVWYVLPSIRKELARVLVEESHLSQKEVANKLGLTESAISQYLKAKRGDELKFSQEILGEIKVAAEQIANSDDESMVIGKICSICNVIKNKGALCQLHKSDDSKLENCNACIGGACI